jgi:hypothetical protein
MALVLLQYRKLYSLLQPQPSAWTLLLLLLQLLDTWAAIAVTVRAAAWCAVYSNGQQHAKLACC